MTSYRTAGRGRLKSVRRIPFTFDGNAYEGLEGDTLASALLAKAEVILWRRGEGRFEVFFARSFADYGWVFLVEAARSPAV